MVIMVAMDVAAVPLTETLATRSIHRLNSLVPQLTFSHIRVFRNLATPSCLY